MGAIKKAVGGKGGKGSAGEDAPATPVKSGEEVPPPPAAGPGVDDKVDSTVGIAEDGPSVAGDETATAAGAAGAGEATVPTVGGETEEKKNEGALTPQEHEVSRFYVRGRETCEQTVAVVFSCDSEAYIRRVDLVYLSF